MISFFELESSRDIIKVEQTNNSSKTLIVETLTQIYSRYKGEIDHLKLLYLTKLATDDLLDAERIEINNLTIHYSQHFKSISCAIVTESPAQTASAMLYSEKETPEKIRRKVFTTEEAALYWLQKDQL